MSKKPPKTPFQSLLNRVGMSRDEASEISGLSINSIRKACYNEEPKGWIALLVEVDRLHRVVNQVTSAENDLLRAQLDEAKENGYI